MGITLRRGIISRLLLGSYAATPARKDTQSSVSTRLGLKTCEASLDRGQVSAFASITYFGSLSCRVAQLSTFRSKPVVSKHKEVQVTGTVNTPTTETFLRKVIRQAKSLNTSKVRLKMYNRPLFGARRYLRL